MSHVPLVFIIAGEASGDQLGADLMASLKRFQDVRFAGIGGPKMAEQGLISLFPIEELSLMGIGGIIRHLPRLLIRLNHTVETIKRLKPDVVVTIDAQEFSYRILKRLHKLPSRPRLIHYVAPTVWAWRPGRAQKLAKIADHLLCLYPFEPPYFEKYGLKTTFVGHPIAQEHIQKEERDPDLICMLPGSRASEIETLLPIFGRTAALLKHEIRSLKVIIPTLASKKELVEQETRTWPCDVQIVVGDEARQAAFQKASVALAASGTVALQLAAAGLPFVVAYKIGKLSEWIGRLIIQTPWVCMVNILLKKQLISELLQDDCTPEKLSTILLTLLKDPKMRYTQEKAMGEAVALLKADPHLAARIVLQHREPLCA